VVGLVTKAIVESHVRTCRCSSDELDKLRQETLSAPQQKLYQNMVRRHDNTHVYVAMVLLFTRHFMF